MAVPLRESISDYEKRFGSKNTHIEAADGELKDDLYAGMTSEERVRTVRLRLITRPCLV